MLTIFIFLAFLSALCSLGTRSLTKESALRNQVSTLQVLAIIAFPSFHMGNISHRLWSIF